MTEIELERGRRGRCFVMAIMDRKLRGKKVAILAGDGFEYVELAVPKTALKAAGAKVDVISIHEGRIRGMNMTEPTRTVAVDRLIDYVGVDDYDALLIVGGFIGPDLLRQSHLVRSFVRAFDLSFKPIATLCHGPLVLLSADVVDHRRLAAWPGIRDDILHAGGIWRDEPLVRDRNWISSRGPEDLTAFVPAMIELFAHGAAAEASGPLAGASTENENSPRPLAPPELVVAAARHLPGPAATALAAVAVTVGALALRRVAG